MRWGSAPGGYTARLPEQLGHPVASRLSRSLAACTPFEKIATNCSARTCDERLLATVAGQMYIQRCFSIVVSGSGITTESHSKQGVVVCQYLVLRSEPVCFSPEA